jgi:DNA-binding transcriptional LysR family regulator
VRHLRRAGDRDDPGFLSYQPGERDLAGSCLLAFGPAPDEIDERQIVSRFSAEKRDSMPRMSPAEPDDPEAREALRLDEIEAELNSLRDLRDTPSGTVRINCSEHAAETILWPKLSKVLADYPEIKVEIFIEHSFTDIAAERFDAGVRLGDSVEKDMIAVPIGPRERLVAVATPSYLDRHPRPETPQDLVAHSCINLRLATRGGLYAWEFERDHRPVRGRVDGQLTFNTIRSMVEAALAGFGIGFVPEDSVRKHIEAGDLVPLLDGWCQPFPGFHLYYPSRRQNSAAFDIIVNILRYRG